MIRLSSFRGIINGLSPAYAAALALVLIQVSIGLMYKAAQTGGKYAFSPTSSVTISETLKFLLSTFLFHREWRKRRGAPRSSQTLSQPLVASVEDGKEERDDDVSSLLSEDPFHESEVMVVRRTFFQAVREEIPSELKFGFAHLALFYTLINNIIFVLFRLADPGTIQLIKSGTTLITAVVMIFALGTHIALGQWVAIGFQVCGIIVTQYKPSGGAAYLVTTYMILLFQTTISAISSVYNQKLCKSSDGSLHVMNMSLYACGAVINLVLHIMVRIVNSAEPGFLTGYGSFGAVMVIVSNVFIGLAMTAVYKYADALIKCFATALSTAILLYLSPLLFDVQFSFLVVPGSCVVFLATWLYMDSSPKKPSNSSSDMKPAENDYSRRHSFFGRIVHSLSPHGPLRRLGLVLTTSLAFMIIFALTYYRTHMMPGTAHEIEAPIPLDPTIVEPGTPGSTLIHSSFEKTIGWIRFDQLDEKQLLANQDGYAGFFKSIHLSMANENIGEKVQELERDYLRNAWVTYRPLIFYLKAISEDAEFNDATGLLYFKGHSWISPIEFGDMDFSKIWTPDHENAPPFACMTETYRMEKWGGFKQGWHYKGKEAVHIARSKFDKYKINPDEFCTGFSDYFYLPRRFFKDFLNLAPIFLEKAVPDQIALPTMWHIIDQTYQVHKSQSLVYRWSDCIRTTLGVSREQVQEHRCGGRLENIDSEEAQVHFARLREDRALLGKSIAGNVDLGSENPVETELETFERRSLVAEDIYGVMVL